MEHGSSLFRADEVSSRPLLEVAISADYPAKPGVLRDVRFEMQEGEILGLIGESGSGKSTIAFAIPRLLEMRGGIARGSIRFRGRELMATSEREMRSLRGREISIVLQSPMTALNPALRLETQLREVWRAHNSESWNVGRETVCELLERMGLPSGGRFLRRYPRELSVGQAQRVVITMAVLHRPKLLIADEPTSALDPVTGHGILELFRKCNREFGAAILYVSHDLASVANLCHRVAVVYEGSIAGWGAPEEILESNMALNAYPETAKLPG
ncbi:MAG TPA: ABC transporter ATP-binding protein [Bryobacteraceae bacterium]|jgi:ABC-type glutathione transport system ATPase component